MVSEPLERSSVSLHRVEADLRSNATTRLLAQGALAAEYVVVVLSETMSLVADVLQQPESEAVT